MLNKIIEKYGKDKINSLTKYPSILTLHNLGEKGRLLDTFTTPIQDEKMYASEKIDGTNVRIIILDDEYLIGARDTILSYSEDLFFDPSMGIVDSIEQLKIPIPRTSYLTVIYGELYGGKIGPSKNYGTEKVGFRVFDIVEFNDEKQLNLYGVPLILDRPIEEISRWREHESQNGLVYGQNFLAHDLIKKKFPFFEFVPQVEFDCGDYNHETILENLKKAVPETIVALSDKALKRAEGVVLRNSNRTKIVKIRFEDYERTIKNKSKK